MKRVAIFAGLILLVLLPIILLVLRNPLVSMYLRRTFGIPGGGVTAPQYTAESKATGKKLTLEDTRYLEYVAANLGIFEIEGVYDRDVYRGNRTAPKKHTVTRVKFELMDDLNSYVYGLTGGKLFAAKGDYRVEGETLLVSVAIFPDSIENNPLGSTYALEQAYLKTAFVTLLYAHGISDPRSTATQLEKLKRDMKEYLESGMFAWPIRIDTQ